MSPEGRLQELRIELLSPPKAAGNYLPGVQIGNLPFMSGCVPRRTDGTYVTGKVGADLSVEKAYQAARLAGLAMLSRVRSVAGSLDRVKRVVKVMGTLLDTCMGLAVLSTLEKGFGQTTLEFKISLVRSISPDTGLVRAEGSVLNGGRRVGTAEGRLSDSQGRLLAHGTTTCLLFQS
jgi:enamine deaminase RidA (YjgF/YER057c/UK114 family)